MDDFEESVLRDYIGNNWDDFKEHCDIDYNEDGLAQKIYKDLGGEI